MNDTSPLEIEKVDIPAASELAPFAPDPEWLEESKVVSFKRRDIKARPFNLLRSQVLKKAEANGWGIIGVTSATPGVGKSFLTANLAAALSKLPERQVYLFDLDVRRGTLAELFGLEQDYGLVEYLTEPGISLSQVGRNIGDNGLSFYPSFTGGDLSAELFGTPRFRGLVEAMRGLPDKAIVLCDLPPAFANDDAMIITQQLDAYLLVVEQGQTTQAQLRDTVRLLNPAPCLGTVLNRYQGGFGDSYGYGYGYNDKYDKYY
jgi:Mrp family chromosome partitioning ATPase